MIVRNWLAVPLAGSLSAQAEACVSRQVCAADFAGERSCAHDGPAASAAIKMSECANFDVNLVAIE
jgi:hypothetical protein